MFALVLTYGIPQLTFNDQNLCGYADGIIEEIENLFKEGECTNLTLVLNGGETNPAIRGVTEARAAGVVLKTRLQNIDRNIQNRVNFFNNTGHALDLWESISHFAEIVKRRSASEPVLIFCEYHRRHRVYFIAKKILGERGPFIVIPIDFDRRRYTVRDYGARTIEFGSAVASWHIPLFYELVERPLRMEKIGRRTDGSWITP
jgi:hypothetical protein